MQPLANVRVLDFTTLLPGPMATLILAEAGAEVIKIELPEGEEMRRQLPRFGDSGALFALLNRGKKSIAIDLKRDDAVALLTPLIEAADVVVEQFRPGVMKRLNLDYASLQRINPRLIYCAITGYGQTGERAGAAGHDLNYAADSGLLSLSRGADGAPVIPHAQIADIGGGTYPAVINILLALRERDRTGKGCALDIAMTDNLFPFLWMAMGLGQVTGHWPQGGDLVLNGASPRYQVYRTRDDAFIAVGALEQKFWDALCECLELEPALRDDRNDPEATRAAVAGIIARRTAADWESVFAGKDVCANVVRSVEEAFRDRDFQARRLFAYGVAAQGRTMAAAAVPVAPRFRRDELVTGYPALGSANALLDEAPVDSIRHPAATRRR